MTVQQIDEPMAESVDHAPLILTLELSEPAQGMFQSLRDRYFPPERNLVPAHVSMFHKLPGLRRRAIERRLRELGVARFPVGVEAPFTLGRGVAFRVAAPELLAARGALARDWQEWLGAQDRQGWRPHVTVQNKVTAERARATLSGLAHGFVPFRSEAVAWRLWRYLDGPWEALARVALLEPTPGA